MEHENQNIIELSKIFNLVKENFFSIIMIISISVLIGTGSSYLFEKKYTSIAKLMPVESYDKSNSLGSSLNLNSVLGGEQNKKVTSNLELLNTKDFFEKLLENEFIRNDIKNIKDGFLGKLLSSNAKEKSFDSSYTSFYTNRLGINFNLKKEILTLSITHPDKETAKKILDAVIYEYNIYVKNRDILKATRSIELLREEIAKTQSTEVKLVLSNYLFQDLRKLQLSEISDEYAFELIESPRVPERKSSPNRVLFLFVSFFVGLFLSFIFIIYSRKSS